MVSSMCLRYDAPGWERPLVLKNTFWRYSLLLVCCDLLPQQKTAVGPDTPASVEPFRPADIITCSRVNQTTRQVSADLSQ